MIQADSFCTLYRGVSEIGVEEGHSQIYFGQYLFDPGVTFYFVVFALKTSVLTFAGFFGAFYFLKKTKSHDSSRFFLYIGLFALLYLLQITFPSKKLDRYLLPTIISTSMLSGYFIYSVFKKLSNIWHKRIAVFIFAVVSVFNLVRVHPDYFSYFNPLFGGLGVGIKVIEPKWLIGGPEIIAYLRELKQKEGLTDFQPNENIDNLLNAPALTSKLTVGFQEKYYTQIWPFVRETGAWPVIEDLSPYAVKTKYFIYPVWDDISSQETRFKLEYYDSIKIRGIETWKVYKRL
jgi:hypothetical protein